MAKAHGQAALRDVGVQPVVIPTALRTRRRDRTALLATTALQAVTVLVLAQPALAQLSPNARPTGGQVVGGQVGISQSQQTTTVQQGSQYGAINWQSYNVGASHTVQYQQPNAQASTLNRVVGPDPSLIAGRITANGNVVLVNQSGVVFDRGAQVDVHGLIVTSNNIRTQDFMAGRMNFDQPGSPNAQVVNHGTITVRESGLAALVAPSVANHGVINARMGKVVLAGATAHTVDLYGDGLIAVDVTGQVKQVPLGPDGKPVTALVTNTGTIIADGGTIVLTAKAVDGIIGNLVSAGGRIQANTVGGKAGRIEIAGVGGGLTIEGDIVAMGLDSGTKGGSVQALATGDVTVKSGARIDVSGQAGGGTMAIGTTLDRAAGPVVKNAPMAARVSVEKGAVLAADATVNGKGGSIVMLAAGTTRMNGTATARGGALGGDGGFVEISGKTLSSITGKVDVTAPHGKNGSILIDPDFLTIVADAAGNGDQDATFSGASGTIVAGDASVGADTLSNGVLNAFAGDVLLQANQTITVGANVSLTTTPGQSLTMEAGGTIAVNAGVVVTVDGNVFLGTGGANLSGAPPAAQPSPLISVLGSIQSVSGSVTLNAGAGSAISVGSAGKIQAATAASLTGDVVNVAGTVLSPSVTLVAATGTLGLTGTVNASTAVAMFGAGGIVGSAGRVIGGGGLSALSTSGDIVLNNANNDVVAALFNASGSVNFVNSSSLNLGQVTAGPSATISAPTLVVSDTIAASSVNLTASVGTLTLASTVNAATVALSGQAGIAGATGTVVGNTALTATSGSGAVDLSNTSNQITSASGAAATDFTLTSLVVLDLGTVTAPTSATITADTLTVNGVVTAATAQLASATGTLTLNGTIDASTIAVLNGFGGVAGPTGRVIGNGILLALSSGGNVVLDNANNAIATAVVTAAGAISLVDLGNLNLGAITAGTTATVSAQTLSVNDVVNAATVNLTASVGTLTLTNAVSASAVALSGQAGIAGATGTILGGGSLSAISAGGDVDLSNAANAVATVSGSAGGGFTFAQPGALDLGTVTAGATATVTADTLTVTGAVSAGTANLTASVGTLTLTNAVSAGAIALSGQAGIAGAAGTILGGGSLSAISAAGDVDLSNAANAVTAASGSAAGVFVLVNTGAVNVGTVTAPTAVVVVSDTLTVSGLVTSSTANLNATVGTLTLTGTVDASVIDLVGQAGIAGSTGTLIGGGVLTANSAGGDVNLTNAANDVVQLGGTAAGSFGFAGSTAFTINNITATGGDVFLRSTDPGGIIFGAGALVAAPSGGRVTLRADQVSNFNFLGATGVVDAGATGVLELAPETLGAPMSLGSLIAGTLSLETLIGVTVGTLSLGAATDLSGTRTVTAGTINVGGAGYDLAGGTIVPTALILNAAAVGGGTGDVGQTAPLLNVGTLSGVATSFNLTNSGNTIAAVSGLTASAAANLASAVSTTLGTVVAGTTASISAPILTVAGSVAAPTVSLTATAGTLTLAGTVSASTFAALSGQLGIAGGGGTVLGGGSLSAISTLGAVVLSNALNQIGTASGSALGVFTLDNAIALNTGNITGGTSVAVSATTLTAGGSIAAPAVTLTATAGTLTVSGTVNTPSAILIGQSGIDATTGTIIGSTTLAANSAAGGVVVTNAGNAIAAASGTAATGFAVVSTLDLDYGNVSAGTTASASAPNLTASGSIIAPVVTLAATSGLLDIIGTVDATTQATGTGPSVSVGGTVIAPSTTLTASLGLLTLTGLVNASTNAALSGQSGIAGAAGRVIGGGTLSAISGAGNVDLTNAANTFASASGSAAGAFSLVDLVDLVLDNVTAGTAASITAPNLTAGGTVTADTALLTATTGTLSIPGVVNATTQATGTGPTVTVAGNVTAPTTTLTASTGTLSLTGTVSASIAAVLSGQAGIVGTSGRVIGGGALTANSAAGAVDLGNLTNDIASAAGSAATSFTLSDTGALILGSISAGTTASIIADSLSVTGNVVAPTVSLTASTGVLDIIGAVNASTAAVLSGAGGITGATGLVIGGGALTATSSGGSIDLSNTANAVASVTGNAAGAFTLADSIALDVVGVTAGTAITISAPTLTASGAVTAPNVTLTANTGTLGVTGIVTASVLATLSGNTGVVGPTGTILGNGALNAISAAGGVDLTNAANQIASVEGSALGAFAVSSGTGLSILSGRSVTADTVTLTAVSVTNDGTVTASGAGLAAQLIATGGGIVHNGLLQAGAGRVLVQGITGVTSSGTITAGAAGSNTAPSIRLATVNGDITQTGGLISATDAAGYVTVTSSGGGISLAGSVAAGPGSPATGTIELLAETDISQTGGSAALIAGLIQGSTSGSIALDSGTGNRIATVGPLSASGGLSLINGRDLTLNGPVTVSSGPISITTRAGDGTTGALTNVGIVSANGATSGRITLTADGGITNASGAVITGAGLAASPSVALTSGASIINAAGATIRAINPISGSVALTAVGDITSAGTIIAAGVFPGISSIALTAGRTIAQTGGLIAATHPIGSAALNAGSIDLAGTLTVGAGGSLSLNASGQITEGGGTGLIIAGQLSGSSGSTTTLDNITNQIGTIGPFSAADSLVLRNGTPTLTAAGDISVANNGTLVLQNGVTGGSNNLTLADGARLQAANVTLLAPGIIDGRGASVIATTLTLPSGATGQVGQGAGVTSTRQAILGDPVSGDPVPINSIGTLGPVVASESLVVMNATQLLLAGDITAPTIRIGATGGMTIANNVTVTTGGSTLTLPVVSTVPPDTDATSGFNIALLASSGTIDLGSNLTIRGIAGTPQPTFRIAQTQGGQVLFGNLDAPDTNVILHVGTGAANSKPGTEINIGNLFAFYRSGAPAISLSGKVAGQTAQGAASISRIGRETSTSAFGQTAAGALIFDPSAQYQINQCSITSINCILTATLQIPPLLPLQVLYLPLPSDVLDDPDLLLPLISEQDD